MMTLERDKNESEVPGIPFEDLSKEFLLMRVSFFACYHFFDRTIVRLSQSNIVYSHQFYRLKVVQKLEMSWDTQ